MNGYNAGKQGDKKLNGKDITKLIFAIYSLVELAVRLKQQMPEAFASEEEALQALEKKVAELSNKPADYLQNWEPPAFR